MGRKTLIRAAGTAVAFVAGLMLAMGSLGGIASASGGPKDRVTICHATGSSSNPYVMNHPAADGDVSGHDGHGDDIIPPFTYEDGGATK
jgi:hypothetical protein